MSAETALIDVLAALFRRPGVLAPAPVSAGAALPVAAVELPAIVIALPALRRLGAGLGERASMMTGALPVQARIDLANPVLPAEPGFNLLSADRRTLVLPHGGWVTADGLEVVGGAMAAADLQVSVAGAPRTLVNAPPAANEVRPDAATGTLLFGAALPPVGIVQASYFLGQWERRMTPIAGTLELAVRAASAADAAALSAALLDLMDNAAAWPAGLHKVALLSLSSIGAIAATDPLPGSRTRTLAYRFEYEHIVDRADSSGGVIRRIPITSRLLSTAVDPGTGAITTSLSSELTEARP